MAGLGELVGGLGLAMGLLTPLAAAAVIGTMTTAAFVNNAENGFWSVVKGWELNGYLIVVATALAVTGPGSLSVDAWLGLPALTGVATDGVVGLGLAALGFLGGWVRWVTRRPAST
jgi:putative oxidoreductase